MLGVHSGAWRPRGGGMGQRETPPSGFQNCWVGLRRPNKYNTLTLQSHMGYATKLKYNITIFGNDMYLTRLSEVLASSSVLNLLQMHLT